MVVLALVGILCSLATWGSERLLHNWQTQRAVQQVLEDLKSAQAYAETAGPFALDQGRLIPQRTFLVFNPDRGRYTLHLWRDLDEDGQPHPDETRALWERALPPGVQFGWQTPPRRKACSNVAGTPTAPVTFASPGYAPCNDQPCIKFDAQGFSEIGPGGIYLHDGDQSLAITGTRPGHFTVCRWNGHAWH